MRRSARALLPALLLLLPITAACGENNPDVGKDPGPGQEAPAEEGVQEQPGGE